MIKTSLLLILFFITYAQCQTLQTTVYYNDLNATCPQGNEWFTILFGTNVCNAANQYLPSTYFQATCTSSSALVRFSTTQTCSIPIQSNASALTCSSTPTYGVSSKATCGNSPLTGLPASTNVIATVKSWNQNTCGNSASSSLVSTAYVYNNCILLGEIVSARYTCSATQGLVLNTYISTTCVGTPLTTTTIGTTACQATGEASSTLSYGPFLGVNCGFIAPTATGTTTVGSAKSMALSTKNSIPMSIFLVLIYMCFALL